MNSMIYGRPGPFQLQLIEYIGRHEKSAGTEFKTTQFKLEKVCFCLMYIVGFMGNLRYILCQKWFLVLLLAFRSLCKLMLMYHFALIILQIFRYYVHELLCFIPYFALPSG